MNSMIHVVKLMVYIPAIIVLSAFQSSGIEGQPKKLAYTVCDDRRVYLLDLDKNIVVHKSNAIKEIGRPVSIAIDREKMLLYVASERGRRQYIYTPIVKFDISSPEPKLIDNFYLIQGEPNGIVNPVSPIFEMIISPDGEKLYIMYGHKDYTEGSAVVDSKTGNILEGLNIFIGHRLIFSPDGKKVVEIWPKQSKKVIKDGQEIIKEWPGGVVTYDLEKKTKVIFRNKTYDNGGLHPYWGKIDAPLVYLENFRIIESYNRDTGDLISSIEIKSLFADIEGSTASLLLFENNSKAVFTTIGSECYGYVIVLDLERGKVLSRLKVGKYPRNVVFLNNIE